MADERTFVIVGASLAGAKAAETLRTGGFSGRIVLIGEETERPYERPPLSKAYLQGDEDARGKAFVHPEEWYAENDVDLRLGTRVTRVDPAARTVTLDGVDELHYDKLLLTTGSRVRTLDVPGADLTGVRYLRTVDEADALLAHLRAAAHVVVVGAGWIGLETAAAARKHGATATVVEVADLPLQRVLGDEVATVFADLHRANGVTFRFGASVARFTGVDGKLTGVVLADGTELPADVAVVGVGIQPNTELAVDAGLEVDNGIVVDAALRTSDPDIYAAGDVVNLDHPGLGRRVRVEHWANALNGGKVAAASLLGEASYDRVPYFFSDQFDLGMEYSGFATPGGYDQVVFRGGTSVADGFIAFWVKDGRVLAGMNVNVWDVTDDIQALVRAGWAGTAVDLEGLADPKVALADLLG
ncbi:NAD(P)/FAD-dependent oxidoreductase [Dactylosporangium siamense]|uniref:Pyridine nucleotide-disulfide oxidoreductase n=1 Tax=Dactylosporangium siamense TaxID=685454 RepID=A0A919PP00_9ACTN|nr:FAD-dependent oxidoreductase [Dactylosporangium siamense]GIG45875.1 pyridine nucleotide-disulfide oxidoreductase [Dactylosporangium siamense]